GFRTLAIQKSSSEVWNLLATVRNEFGKFGDALSKVREKLDQASRDMDKVEVRSRAIAKQLQKAESLPTNPQPFLPELLSEPEEEDL
ncbi:MAG: recombination protein RmuC, partial [Verrucomicrobiota bacterium]